MQHFNVTVTAVGQSFENLHITPSRVTENVRLDHTGKITVLIEEITSEGGISASAGAGLYWLIIRSPDICQTGTSTGQIVG